MNCLVLVLLLLCCGNNSDSGCGNDRRNDNGGRGRERGNDDCGCGRERNRNDNSDNNGCDCRSDFRQESRFEQRPFMFNQNSGCGCEEAQNNSCDR